MPPYLVAAGDQELVSGLPGIGFEVVSVDASTVQSERQLLRQIGQAVGFPDDFKGGVDAFFDLLSDFIIERARFVIVNLAGVDELAVRDPRLFARAIWLLMSATESVEVGAKGEGQLEFIFLGDWPTASEHSSR